MVQLQEVQQQFDAIFDTVGDVVVGQEEALRQVVIALLCDANVLLEGYPGLAKTLSVRTLSQLMDLKFSRIQGTPDLMPSDITGTYIIDESGGKRSFTFQRGPIFANIVLMDEINRATPKTQAALLEAMQEKQVTSGTKTFELDKPFFVLATQNPIEQTGTFNLPEAQSDRFLLKVKMGYPQPEDELKIINKYTDVMSNKALRPMMKGSALLQLQDLVKKIPVANDIKSFVVDLVTKTRSHKELIEFGASPRASIGLIMASKARALMAGRDYVTKEDVKTMAYPVLRHRLILNFEAERNNFSEDDVVKYLMK
jgi:MoxR-like ATPase